MYPKATLHSGCVNIDDANIHDLIVYAVSSPRGPWLSACYSGCVNIHDVLMYTALSVRGCEYS